MNVTETIQTFLEFLADRGHQVVPGSSLVPPDPILECCFRDRHHPGLDQQPQQTRRPADLGEGRHQLARPVRVLF
jgi:hypothetical protein